MISGKIAFLKFRGGVEFTKPELIVNYTTTKEDEEAIRISFSFNKYPQFKKYNTYRIICMSSTNDTRPWIEIYMYGKKICKLGNWRGFGCTIKKKGNYIQGFIKGITNISLEASWIKEGTYPLNEGVGIYLPIEIGTNETIDFVSYSNIFLENTRIKIWGWNE